MSRLNTSSLMNSISQLLEIQSDVLRSITDEVRGANIPYEALYADFQSGCWHTAVLYAPGEENTPSDGTVRDGAASPTLLAKRLPITRCFLKIWRLISLQCGSRATAPIPGYGNIVIMSSWTKKRRGCVCMCRWLLAPTLLCNFRNVGCI